ncbi:hypothetical protein [Spiroplasma chrysopicola]|uniref:Uncharacterized protein n=1 Tax=Spiroplasma chrysopicola DF-1 TaxID=1276227 RepID=R4UCF0_9MOLU|nr:hypothetical protein [Spiroplasma chrysopicola]AGM25569.1 hypothetical protein SCHRY_v1c09970 [Spiroplasma chrysopicola DF-1]
MKNLLIIISTISLTGSGILTTNLLNENNQNNNFAVANFNTKTRTLNNIWDKVGINHSVVTASSGTDEKPDTKTVTKAMAKISWYDIINKSKYANAHGYFAFHPYKNPWFKDTLQLTFKSEKSTINSRIWEFSDTNDQWSGWGHQTSKISLTLKAVYNDEEGITALELISYIYARTAGSVHECSTASKVDSIQFLLG